MVKFKDGKLSRVLDDTSVIPAAVSLMKAPKNYVHKVHVGVITTNGTILTACNDFSLKSYKASTTLNELAYP